MDKGKLSASADLLRLSTLGLNFVLCNFAGVGIGWLLSHYCGVGDWVVIAGLFLGIVAGYRILVMDLKKLNAKKNEPTDHEK
jgi:ATP synthase protein I